MATKPKVVQLLNLLNDKELESLKNNLIRDDKTRQLTLTENLLLLKDTSFGREQKKRIFKKLFDKSYSSTTDYLLRNEFRLLSRQIEEVLVETELREQLHNNSTLFHYRLLQSFQKRKALELFQKEYKHSYKEALEERDYYYAHNITELKLFNLTHFLNINNKVLPYVKKLNKLKLAHLSSYYLASLRQYQIDRQYIHNNLFPFSTEENHLNKKVDVDFESFETEYSDYLFLKAKSFTVPLSEQVQVLEQCLEHVQYHFIPNASIFEEEVKFCLSSLAQTHSLLSNFEEANRYYEIFFEKCDDPNDPQRLSVMGDYIAHLINMSRISDALCLLNNNATYAEDIPRLKLRWKCLKISCYAITEDVEKLKAALPDNFYDFNKRTKYFFRFYVAIYDFLTKNTEASFREMENLRHLTPCKNDNNSSGIHPIVNFFHRYFYTYYLHPHHDQRHSENLKHLTKDIAEFSSSAQPELRSYLPLLWLKNQLKDFA